ncbi:MAG: glutamyl-tRNA amidotransferase [Legionellales bacterium]|nr:glutamyl-tRNA amidotransferase [Legionellales bacterium]|tara:strand:+ start:16617 stop:17069 length:453 start_codon:yes stop_codon:yes gene_type:complete
MSELKSRINDEMKDAMRAKDKARLGAIRLIMAAMKQKEVDERIELSDADILGILDKMAKQRRESITQYEAAGRDDLVANETLELEVIQSYLPQQLSEDEINQLIQTAISNTGAAGMKDMGKVMGEIKPHIQGRADTGAVSQKVKELLGAL